MTTLHTARTQNGTRCQNVNVGSGAGIVNGSFSFCPNLLLQGAIFLRLGLCLLSAVYLFTIAVSLSCHTLQSTYIAVWFCALLFTSLVVHKHTGAKPQMKPVALLVHIPCMSRVVSRSWDFWGGDWPSDAR